VILNHPLGIVKRKGTARAKDIVLREQRYLYHKDDGPVPQSEYTMLE